MGSKPKFTLPVTRTPAWWVDLASDVLMRYAAVKGAFVWPEAEAELSESSWVHDNFDAQFPAHWSINSHHLKSARRALTGTELTPLTEVLNRLRVTAWVRTADITARGRKTQTLTLAAAKRRAYRTFLGWTGDVRLCGAAGEDAVMAVLTRLRGTHIWVPPNMRMGRVSELEGRPLTVGGPLDAAGHWALDPNRPGDGFVPFAVEVKNVRSTLYPYDHDVWDLLAKLTDFPDVVPVLVARRIHWTTFRMFKDLGVLGTDTRAQLFAGIDVDLFKSTVDLLGFADAKLYDGQPITGLVTFFSKTGPKQAPTSLASWARAAPILSEYADLRDDHLDEGSRTELFRQFADDLNRSELYGGGWAPIAVGEPEFDDEDDMDW
jgi:hypothetical protein